MKLVTQSRPDNEKSNAAHGKLIYKVIINYFKDAGSYLYSK